MQKRHNQFLLSILVLCGLTTSPAYAAKTDIVRITQIEAADKFWERLEGRLEFRYLRRNLSPETTITFTSKIFPLLEDLSVVRAETDLIFKREFISDLFFEVSIGHSFQSDPPDGAEKADYAITTSAASSLLDSRAI